MTDTLRNLLTESPFNSALEADHYRQWFAKKIKENFPFTDWDHSRKEIADKIVDQAYAEMESEAYDNARKAGEI
jgi:hypothetical protein